MKTFKQYHEEKQKGVDGKACWPGYARRGTKKKGDKTVDNCVKVDESSFDPTALLDYAMNQVQEGGQDIDSIRRVLSMLAPDDQTKEYLASDQFITDLEAKLDAYDDEMNLKMHAENTEGGEQIDLGYNLDAIEDLLALLSQYGMQEGKHFVSHVGYGDELPNAITIPDNVLKRLRPEQLEEIQATASASHGEDEWEDEDFQGEYDEQLDEKNARCTKTTKKASSTSKGKKWMKCVKSDSGGYKRIHWGQKGAKVTGKSGNTKRKKSFRARHKCSTAKSNTPRGQACKDW